MSRSWALGACIWAISICGSAFAEPATLSLQQAISSALAYSPALQGAEADVAGAKGESRQSGVLPNPVLSLDAENIGGSGLYTGADGAELTAGVLQLVQIGGKRAARIKTANAGQLIATYNRSGTKQDVILNTTAAFYRAVSAQEQAALADEQLALARDVYKTVDRRVAAAAEPLVQRSKAKIALANAELSAARANGQKDSALKVLTALWGGGKKPVLVTKPFYTVANSNVSMDGQKSLLESVDYQQQTAVMDQANSMLALERANALPDPSVTVGVRELRQSNDQAFVVGVSMPLPVFNTNRGNIEKARQTAVKAAAERQRLLLTGQVDLVERQQQLQNAYLTATSIRDDILPAAQTAFKQAKQGYDAGKFAYLEVLDAQRTLTETRLSYITALEEYHLQEAALNRLLSKPANDSSETIHEQ